MERQRGYQRHPRVTKRLEVTFSAGGLSYKGILSNLSENGLFIRTNNSFAPNTVINIELLLPDNRISYLKGIVRRSVKSPFSTVKKNGMGIELLEKDAAYIKLVRSLFEEQESVTEETPLSKTASDQEFHIVSCSNCGVKNKVLTSKFSFGPKCGKCGTPLVINRS